MNQNYYVGIDFSISCPCICVIHDTQIQWAFVMEKLSSKWDHKLDPYFTSRIKAIPVGRGKVINEVDRYRNICLPLMGYLLETLKDVDKLSVFVAIEGYSMGSKGKVFNLAEHTGMFKYMLSSSGHKYTTVAPTTVKKFATDSGRSDKFAMMTFFNKEHGRDLISLSHAKTVASPYSDIVDSYFIAKWCCVNANEIPVG